MLSPLSKVIPSFGAPTLQDFDTANVAEGQRIGGSKRQYVRFYKKKWVEIYTTKARINEKTGTSTPLETGTREVEKEFVHIVTPGDKNAVDDFAQDFHRREHWAEYKAFRDGRTAPLGMSIDECTFISPSIATELKYLGVHTVEQLADGADILCNQIANGWELREYARAVCKANKDNQSLEQVNLLKGELVKSQEMILQMQSELQALKNGMAPSAPVVRRKRTVITPETQEN